MKTTIEIPDVLFRRAKSKAAERSQTLKEFVSEALQEKLADEHKFKIYRHRLELYGRCRACQGAT